MRVYVESNFVIERALLQEQWRSCERILELCESGGIRLVVPAYCLTEPYETLTRRHRRRRNIKQDIDNEFGQIARTETHADRLDGFRNVTDLLIKSAEEEDKRLNDICRRLLEKAEVVPLDARILAMSAECRRRHDFSPQDSIVYASVLSHLEEIPGERSCFLNRDKGFDDQDVVEELGAYRCDLLPGFDAGYRFIVDNEY